jgi:hypothetical protein
MMTMVEVMAVLASTLSLSTVGAAAAGHTQQSHAVPLFRHHALGTPAPMRSASATPSVSRTIHANVPVKCSRRRPVLAEEACEHDLYFLAVSLGS